MPLNKETEPTREFYVLALIEVPWWYSGKAWFCFGQNEGF